MEALVEQVHESCSASVLDGGSIVYVARVPTKRIMAISLAVGSRLPAHATSMGRVLLAELPQAALDEFFESATLTRFTERTIVNPIQLREILGKVNANGWALIDQELEVGLRSIAAPIYDANGSTIAAINVATHVARVSIEKLEEEFLPLLLDAAAEISAALVRR
jgi:IclR family pca regulon transcriptional regulator